MSALLETSARGGRPRLCPAVACRGNTQSLARERGLLERRNLASAASPCSKVLLILGEGK
jgi:hypothetical protein